MRTVSRRFLQVLIGVIVIGAGSGKALDLGGFVDVLDTYRVFPPAFLWPVALLVTGGELVFGAWLLSGIRLRTTAALSILLHIAYTLWLTVALARGLDLANCGCFGVYLARPLSWFSPIEDVILAALSVLLMRLAPP